MPRLDLTSATDPASEPALRDLEQKLQQFYNGALAKSYFQTAQSVNECWDGKPMHELIRSLCKPAMDVADLGCGSGHAYENLKETGIRYLGVDWSQEQIERNRSNYPSDARFEAASLYETGFETDRFDLVFSLYVLEHLVYPHRFLHEAMRIVKPGGTVVILCPNFRPFGRIPSLHYGRRVAVLKDRIREGHLLAAGYHLLLRNVCYPLAIKRRYPKRDFPFLINLSPTCLRGSYYPDNDAVYLVDRDEVAQELCRAGGTEITRSVAAETEVAPTVCFVAVRKDGR